MPDDEEELDRKYGKGLNAEGKPRVKQALVIHDAKLGVVSLIEQEKENEDGKDSS